jgi:hypothetical protein
MTTILGRDHHTATSQLKAQEQQALMIMKHQALKKQKLVLEKYYGKGRYSEAIVWWEGLVDFPFPWSIPSDLSLRERSWLSAYT